MARRCLNKTHILVTLKSTGIIYNSTQARECETERNPTSEVMYRRTVNAFQEFGLVQKFIAKDQDGPFRWEKRTPLSPTYRSSRLRRCLHFTKTRVSSK